MKESPEGIQQLGENTWRVDMIGHVISEEHAQYIKARLERCNELEAQLETGVNVHVPYDFGQTLYYLARCGMGRVFMVGMGNLHGIEVLHRRKKSYVRLHVGKENGVPIEWVAADEATVRALLDDKGRLLSDTENYT